MQGGIAVHPYIYINKVALLHLKLLLLDGQLLHPTLAECHTGLLQRTLQALRRLGRAKRGTEVHHALVEKTHPRPLPVKGGGRETHPDPPCEGGEKFLCQESELLLALGGVDGSSDAEVATQHTIDITIHHGGRQSEGKAADGCSGIVTDALERTETFYRRGEATHRHHLLGGGMQVAGTTVVSQALPLAQHLILRGGGQVVHRRPAAHEALPVGTPLFDARLLQDNLRQPDGIRVAGVAPRQVSAMLPKPLYDCRCK